MDYLHGFSLQPENINIQVLPGYEHVVHRHADARRNLLDRLQRVLRHRPPHDGGNLYVVEKCRGAAHGKTSRAQFRTCPHAPACSVSTSRPETLIKVNAVAAVVFLLVGGLLALLVALTRWPAVHLLPADWFYLALTAHGLDMLIFWIIFFEIAILYFCSSTLLKCRLATPRMAWVAFALMVIGAMTTNVIRVPGRLDRDVHVLRADAGRAASSTSGLILFAVGALIGCFVFLGTLVVGQGREDLRGLDTRW